MLKLEQEYHTTPSQIWKALTDPAEMKKWYFDIPDFNPVPGFEFSFSAGPAGKEYLHLCKIIESEKDKILSYTWRYDGYDGDSLVTFEIIKAGENTLIKLKHEGLETFPSTNPDFAKENFIEGWNHFLKSAMLGYFENNNN